MEERSARGEAASAAAHVMSPGGHSGDVGENLFLQRSSRQAEALSAIVLSLADLNAVQLCLQWRNHLGGKAPAHLPRWLLLRVLAYRLQATALGDLDKATARIIRASQGGAIDFSGNSFKTRGPVTRNGTALNPGALLVREWKGKLEKVKVLDKGFAWNGRTFGSLSQVAKAITSTSWNGHRFFGLRSVKHHDSKSPPVRLSGNKGTERGGAPSEPLGGTETDEGRRAVNANRSGVYLAPRGGRNPETKTHVPVENEPARDTMDVR
jgi:Protein of unknown function (DUF2924)